MKKHLLFLCCLVMAALTLPSCSSDDGEGGTVIPPGGQGGQGGTGSTSYESLIIGEWGQVLLEYKYFNDITKTSDGHLKGNAAYWTFGHDSYFKHVNSEVPGTYSLQGDKLTTNWTAGGSTDFTILKLDKDSLVVKLLFNGEYGIDIEYVIQHMKRLTPYSDEDEDGGDAVVNTDIFAGEWQETREECYMSYGDELAYSNKNTKSVWLLNSDGYFYCISSGSGNCAGSWKHNGEILTVNAGNWEVTRRTISYLDTDSFCVKMDYTYDTFYLNYFRRLSYGAEVTASMEQFVGTWNMNDGEHNDWYWLFSPNGNLYIGRENISSDRYYYKGKWSYAPASKILVTNLNYDNVPSDLLPDPHFDTRVFMWKVTSLPRNGQWEGEALYTVSGRHEKEVTFTMADWL